MFNWGDLRVFIAITRTQSLSEAASKLGINHTTVARRIKALEESLAARLFAKTPSGYLLTAAGSELLKIAEQVESQCLAAEQLVAGRDPTSTGTVRISVREGFGGQFLVRHLGDFYKKYPEIDLEILAVPDLLSISKRETDILITSARPSVGRLVARELTGFTLCLYASRQYLSRRPPIESIGDLQAHYLIGSIDDLYPEPRHHTFDQFFPEGRVRLRLIGGDARLAAIESGLGIGLVPFFLASRRKNLIPVLPTEVRINLTYWLCMHEDMRKIRRVTTVWNWIKSLVATHQSELMGL